MENEPPKESCSTERDLTEKVRLDGVNVIMTERPEVVIKQMKRINALKLPRVEHLREFRGPLAIVAGGPSLNDTYKDIAHFRNIMVCGSAHDHANKLGIRPNWVVISDPSPIAAKYLQCRYHGLPVVRYLLASHCSDAVFDILSDRDVTVWNCGDHSINSPEVWAGQGTVFGGGCTVLTRAIVLAMHFGFSDFHFFGCDTSVRSYREHHAYEFQVEGEELGELVPIQVTLDGPTFLCASYMVGQFFDLREIISTNAHRLKVTVHGDGLFAEMMTEADRRRKAWLLKKT